jgi:hypothetical protein
MAAAEQPASVPDMIARRWPGCVAQLNELGTVLVVDAPSRLVGMDVADKLSVLGLQVTGCSEARGARFVTQFSARRDPGRVRVQEAGRGRRG